MSSDRELVWMDKERADRFNQLEAVAKNEALDEYLKELSVSLKEEYEASIGAINDDLVIIKGRNEEARKALSKTFDDMKDQAYNIWEKYQEQMPKFNQIIGKFKEEINPLDRMLDSLDSQVDQINRKINSIRVNEIDCLMDTVERFNKMSETEKKLLSSLLDK